MLPDDLHEQGANPRIPLGPKRFDEDRNNSIIGVNEMVVRIVPFGASKLIYVAAGVFVPVNHRSFCLIKGIMSLLNRMIVTRTAILIKNKMHSEVPPVLVASLPTAVRAAAQ